MAENFETFQTGFKNVAQHAEHLDKALGNSELTVRRLIVSFVGSHLAEKLLKIAVAQSTTLTTMKNGFATLERSMTDIVKKQSSLDKQINSNLTEMTALRGTADKKYLASLKQQSLELQSQLNVTNAQLNVKRSLAQFNAVEIGVLALAVKGVRELYNTHKLVNSSLIEANSNLQSRIGITQTVLRTQQMLGSDLQITKEAARALVGYGYDLEDSFAANLKLVVQLHDGLGMSVTQGSELVAVFDRQLKVPVRNIADSIARVVNDTGLAADQAGRLATNIGRAVAALRPGVKSDLAAITELVGKYEGAIQELGGQVGAFSDLLSKMTTPEGMMQAGILGVTDPRFLESRNATKQVVDSFAAYAKRVLGDSRGWDRALRLQVIAEQFGTTAQQVNLMIEAVDRANAQRSSSLTLEQRYREQIRASGESFERIGRSLQTLLQQAALPLLKVLTPLVSYTADFVEYLVQSKVAVYAVSGAFALAMPFITAKVWSATRAFIALAAALTASARAARTRAITEAAQMTLPGFGPGGLGGTAATGTLVSTLPKIVRSLGLIGLALGVGATLGGLYNLIKERQSRIDPKFISELKSSYDSVLKMTVNRQASTGDAASVANSLERARGVYTRRGYSPAEIEARLGRLADMAVDAMGKAKFRKEVSVSSIERDPVTTQAINDINKGQVQMIDIAADQRAAALKQIELQKQQNKAEQEKAEEERRNRLLQPQPFSQHFFRQAYGY